jgi:hypothetical protein
MRHLPSPRYWVILPLLIYLALGSLYVVYTPMWQAPDEPAHFNYIQHIAEQGHLPVLRPGDYPADYMETLKSEHFPPDMSVDSLRYEAWQPPLYYLLGVPIYWATDNLSVPTQVIALRFFSLAIGAVLIWVTYRLIRALCPQRPALALGTATFLTVVPMHVAMLAAINNDGLAALWLTSVLWVSVVMIRRGLTRGRLLLTGVLLGLCLLTKNTAALSIPIALLSLWLATQRANERVPATRWFGWVLWLSIPALILSGWLYIRNGLIYGFDDMLIWQRHAQVAGDQLTTATYIAEQGLGPWLADLIRVTFQSFWGQFGWMAVPMSGRVYLILSLISAMAGLGLCLLIARQIRRAPIRWSTLASLIPLVTAVLFTVGLYLWYNRSFVQFQGRYLFPAIAPIGLAFSLGIREIMRPGREKWWLIVLGGLVLLLLVQSLRSGQLDKHLLGGLAAGGVAFVVKIWLPARYHSWFTVAVYASLAGLTTLAPFWFIIPYLTS